MITSTDHAGRTCTLTHNGQPVSAGEILETGSGDHYRITGGKAPHKPSSTGKVWTDGGEFYPSVFDCTWTPETISQPAQFIVIYGNPADGFSYVGPFASRDDAAQYAADDTPPDWWIVMLDAPAAGA